MSELVVTDSAYGKRPESELTCMICEVCRSAADLSSFRQAVPECLAHSDDISFNHYLVFRNLFFHFTDSFPIE